MFIRQSLKKLMKYECRVILLAMLANHFVCNVLKVQFTFVIGKYFVRSHTDQCVSGWSEICASNSVFLYLIHTNRTKSSHFINSLNLTLMLGKLLLVQVHKSSVR